MKNKFHSLNLQKSELILTIVIRCCIIKTRNDNPQTWLQLMCEHTSNQQVTDACSFFYSLFIICINTTVNKAKFIVRETPNKYINIESIEKVV